MLVSALKPAEDGRALVLRLLNPTDVAVVARVRVGVPVVRAVPLRLDETATGPPVSLDALEVAAHGLCTVRLDLAPDPRTS